MRVKYFTDTDFPWPPYSLHFTWQALMCRVLKIMTTRGKLMWRFWDTTGDSDVPPPDLQAGKLSFVAFSSHSLSLTFWLNHCDICGRWGGEILSVSAEWCPHPLISLRISLLLPPPYITQQSHSGSPSLMSHPLTSLMTTSGNWCEEFGTQLVSVMSHPPICRQENFHLLLFQVILILWLSGWITATSVKFFEVWKRLNDS